jgi:hypothetical protein
MSTVYRQKSVFSKTTRFLKTSEKQSASLRGYWSLELIFLDKILANQGFEYIIEINQFVDLAFSLHEKYVKTFLYAHTP